MFFQSTEDHLDLWFDLRNHEILELRERSEISWGSSLLPHKWGPWSHGQGYMALWVHLGCSHKHPGCLVQSRNVPLPAQQALSVSPDAGVVGWGSSSSLQLLAVLSHGRQGETALWGLLHKSIYPMHEGSAFTIKYVPEPQPQYHHHLGGEKFNIWICGNTHPQLCPELHKQESV